jgi:hypothetical protein
VVLYKQLALDGDLCSNDLSSIAITAVLYAPVIIAKASGKPMHKRRLNYTWFSAVANIFQF